MELSPYIMLARTADRVCYTISTVTAELLSAADVKRRHLTVADTPALSCRLGTRVSRSIDDASAKTGPSIAASSSSRP